MISPYFRSTLHMRSGSLRNVLMLFLVMNVGTG